MQRDQFLRKSLQRLGVERGPAVINSDVAALQPPELLQPLAERRDEAPSIRVALGIRHQHADASQPVALLRARRQRPSSSRAAEQRDDLTAAAHSITSSARASSNGETVRPSALAV